MPRIILIMSSKFYRASKSSVEIPETASLIGRTIGCSTNPNYPAAGCDWTYKVSVAGKIGGVSGVSVIPGDELLCTEDGTALGDQATVGAKWDVVHFEGTGVVPNAPITGATKTKISYQWVPNNDKEFRCRVFD
jgi:hypothetical protein